MSKKLCKHCNKNLIDEKYEFCLDCLKEIKQTNEGTGKKEDKSLVEVLTFLNWNSGRRTMAIEMNNFIQVCISLEKKDMLEKIYEDLKKLYEKDIKAIGKIKEEQEKKDEK